MKLNLTKVNQIRNLLDKGWNSRKIALKYGVHHVTIDDIRTGKTWNPERFKAQKEIGYRKISDEGCHWAKLTETKVKRILVLLKTGISQAEIARKYGVTSQLISLINSNKVWKHI